MRLRPGDTIYLLPDGTVWGPIELHWDDPGDGSCQLRATMQVGRHDGPPEPTKRETPRPPK